MKFYYIINKYNLFYFKKFYIYFDIFATMEINLKIFYIYFFIIILY